MKTFNIRIPEPELNTLKAYCEQENRTQTDVIREFIRSLKKKIQCDAKD
jgi:NRPS condensation-like uncharacterized protein